MAIQIPDGMQPREFFDRILPETFRENPASGDDLEGYRGLDVSMGIEVTGANGCSYTLSIRDGAELEVAEGRAAEPLLSIEVSDVAFLAGLAGRIPELPIVDFLANPRSLITGLPPDKSRQRIRDMQDISGTMEVEAHRGEETFLMSVSFNGAADPSCRFVGEITDLVNIMTGQLNPVQAYMAGKYKIAGSLPFAMKLQKVMPQ